MDIAASHIRALWSYQVASEPDPAILKVDYTENTVMFKIEKNKQTNIKMLQCTSNHTEHSHLHRFLFYLNKSGATPNSPHSV